MDEKYAQGDKLEQGALVSLISCLRNEAETTLVPAQKNIPILHIVPFSLLVRDFNLVRISSLSKSLSK